MDDLVEPQCGLQLVEHSLYQQPCGHVHNRLPARADSGTLSVRVLEDTNTVIWKNPGKGWVSYNWSWPPGYTANEYGMINLLYSRWDWSSIETNENQYNWSQIDTGISQAQANGVQFAFGIMTTDWTDAATPQWVFNDGAAYYTVSGVPIPYWTNNPVFFSKLTHLFKRSVKDITAMRTSPSLMCAILANGARGISVKLTFPTAIRPSFIQALDSSKPIITSRILTLFPILNW